MEPGRYGPAAARSLREERRQSLQRGAGADRGAGPPRRKCPRRQRKRRGHRAAERWKALSLQAGRGLPGAGGSGSGPQACSRTRRGPRGCRLPGTEPGSGGGLKGAARRQSGQLGRLRPWPLPSASHGLRSGRGLRGAAARRHV